MATPQYFQNAADTQLWPTAVGEDVLESIDQDITTFWNPIGAPANHTFSWLGQLVNQPANVDGVVVFCNVGAEPDRIKVWTQLQVNGGVLLANFNSPAWDYTTAPGYAVFDCSGWATQSLTYVHLELQRQGGGPFNLNEVTAYTSPTTWPLLLKRSFPGRNSYKTPGRTKPRFSSYSDTAEAIVPRVYYDVV